MNTVLMTVREYSPLIVKNKELVTDTFGIVILKLLGLGNFKKRMLLIFWITASKRGEENVKSHDYNSIIITLFIS